jgi:hypothetical protein
MKETCNTRVPVSNHHRFPNSNDENVVWRNGDWNLNGTSDSTIFLLVSYLFNSTSIRFDQAFRYAQMPIYEIIIASETKQSPLYLPFIHEIATPVCRNVRLDHLSQAGTPACRHAPFPAFSGTRNDRMGKRIHLLNRNLGRNDITRHSLDGKAPLQFPKNLVPKRVALSRFDIHRILR